MASLRTSILDQIIALLSAETSPVKTAKIVRGIGSLAGKMRVPMIEIGWETTNEVIVSEGSVQSNETVIIRAYTHDVKSVSDGEDAIQDLSALICDTLVKAGDTDLGIDNIFPASVYFPSVRFSPTSISIPNRMVEITLGFMIASTINERE